MNGNIITKNTIANGNMNIINKKLSKKIISEEMSKKIIDCKGLSKMIKLDFKRKLPILMQKFRIQSKPKLKIISVGDIIDNKIYIENKIKACKFIGLDYEHKAFEKSAKIEDILKEIESSNEDDSINGLMVQLPLPEELNSFSKEFINAINPEKDVDGLGSINLRKFINYDQDSLDSVMFSPTAIGVQQIIRLSLFHENNLDSFYENHWQYYSFDEKLPDVSQQKIAVLGYGRTAGYPISVLMEKCKGRVFVIDEDTPQELSERKLRTADIVISAVGKIGLVNEELLKKNCIVVDVGINLIPGENSRKICGDVDFFGCLDKVKFITPVPGGVGVMTVVMLVRNVIRAWLKQNKVKFDEADNLFSKEMKLL